MNSSEINETGPSSEFDENLRMLREIYFFSGLPMEALKLFAYLCTRETYKPGERLMTQDDDDGQAFFIMAGQAVLIHRAGGTDQMLRNFEAGEFIGAMALLGQMRRLFSLQAQSDMTCLLLTREKFAKVMEQLPELMPKIVRLVVERVVHWEHGFLAAAPQCFDDCLQRVGVSLI